MFVVSYDPSATTASAIYTKLKSMGYTPSLTGPVSVKAKQGDIGFQAQASSANVRQGGKLKVVVVLKGLSGKKIAKKGETTVELSGSDQFKFPKAVTVKGGKKSAKAKVKVKVSKKASKGDATITVTVKYTLEKGGETATGTAVLSVPVTIQ